MSGLYAIPISGLKEGRQTFDFKINKAFFEQFEESDVKEGELCITVEADKRSSHAELNIRISGTVTIACDRCLGLFPWQLDCENRLLVKFGKFFDESDPEITTVPADENELDMSQYFYEYVLLALPIKRIHPDDSKGSSACDPVMIKKLKEHVVIEEEKKDPRWEELKKLLNNN
jgi:uncharacterized metal-binding protein YceD (DUF177 family)